MRLDDALTLALDEENAKRKSRSDRIETFKNGERFE